MDAITRSHIQRVVKPAPTPTIGARVGFLSESASEQFLAEYKRLRDANLIVPSALVPAAVGGQILCEAVQAPVQDDGFLEKMNEIAMRTIEGFDDDVPEVRRRLVAALPHAFSELAEASDMSIGDLVFMLLDPEDDMREEANKTLDGIVWDLETKIAEQVAHEDLVDLLEFLDQIPEEKLHVAFDCLSVDQLQALDEFFADEDEEDVTEGWHPGSGYTEHHPVLQGKDVIGHAVKAGGRVRHITQGGGREPGTWTAFYHDGSRISRGHRTRAIASEAVKKHHATKGVSEGALVFNDLDEWKDAVRTARGNAVEFRRVLTDGRPGDTRAFLNGTMLQESWNGEQGVAYTMALSWQPRSTKRTLKDILRSGYVPGSAGDRMFAALHRVEVTDDPSNGD